MATHSSILAWRIPWTELQSMGYSPWGHRESGMTGVTEHACTYPGDHEEAVLINAENWEAPTWQAGWEPVCLWPLGWKVLIGTAGTFLLKYCSNDSLS